MPFLERNGTSVTRGNGISVTRDRKGAAGEEEEEGEEQGEEKEKRRIL